MPVLPGISDLGRKRVSAIINLEADRRLAERAKYTKRRPVDEAGVILETALGVRERSELGEVAADEVGIPALQSKPEVQPVTDVAQPVMTIDVFDEVEDMHYLRKVGLVLPLPVGATVYYAFSDDKKIRQEFVARMTDFLEVHVVDDCVVEIQQGAVMLDVAPGDHLLELGWEERLW